MKTLSNTTPHPITLDLPLLGMQCAACANRIEKALIASTRGRNFRLQTLIREVAFHAAGGTSGPFDEKPKK